MKQFALLYTFAATLFLILDSIWLSLVANKFYKENLQELLANKPLFVPAAIFYAVYIFTLVVFVVKPGIGQPLIDVAWRGALLGFSMYATYDLTNKATLRDWPTSVTIVDLVWGTVATSIVSVGAVIVYTKLVG